MTRDPLGKIAHPRADPEIAAWLEQLLSRGVSVVVPEIADYEVRRSFLWAGLKKSIDRLDALQRVLDYAPISTAVMLRAAEFWAESRRRGRPTADPKELDGDVILAAQAVDGKALVATENIGHLARFVNARHWRDITVP